MMLAVSPALRIRKEWPLHCSSKSQQFGMCPLSLNCKMLRMDDDCLGGSGERCEPKAVDEGHMLTVQLEMDILQDPVAFLDLVKSCSKQKDLDKGSKIHAAILERGLLKKDAYVGTALLDMYAKCGALAKAMQVFDELPRKDVVSWSALIAGYVQHGLFYEAFRCFKRMQVEGVSPNATTFACMLKACGSTKATDIGNEIHAEVNKRGLLGDSIVLGNALVSMYVKCGLLAEAKEVFDHLPAKDTLSWTLLIVGYVQQGLGDEALKCFSQMRGSSITPTVCTFVCTLKACCSIGGTELGEQIHTEIIKYGLLETDTVLGNALVDLYVKCGRLAKAQEVFDKLSVRDVISWTALIVGFAQHGHGDKALKCFSWMREEGILPDATTFSCILKICGSMEAAKMGEEIHAELSRQGLLRKYTVVDNALVDMYGKCGFLERAEREFDKLEVRDVVSWTVFIAGYARYGLTDKALKCFRRMQCEGISPNAATFACILKACGAVGAVEIGKRIHAEISKQGLLGKSIVLGNALVDMYAKCGLITEAQVAFNELPIKDVVSWTVLVVGYVQCGLSDEAINCFVQMHKDGILPNESTFVSILKACGNIRAAEIGEKMHAEAEKQGFLRNNIRLGNVLLDMYAKCGRLTKAQEVFDELAVPDVISWTALISGYAQHGLCQEALKCYGQMQDQNILPDKTTFSCILKACGEVGAIEMGKAIHSEVSKQGLLGENIVLTNALMDMYAKCGLLSKAHQVFERLLVRDVVSWTILIAGYAQHGFGTEALECFERMQDEGISPNAVTFVSILKACGTIGAVDKGKEIHAEIRKQGLIGRSAVLDNALVDMYVKCGWLVTGKSIFDELSVQDLVAWNALISGYVQHGRVQEALTYFEWMQEQDVLPDATTFACILKACGSMGTTKIGEEIHAEINKQGLLGKNTILCSVLVDMYAKNGLLSKAQEVFDELPIRNVVIWTVLIAGYAQVGKIRTVFDLFSKMIVECVEPDASTFAILLAACSHACLVEEGQMHYDKMTKVYSLTPTLHHDTCMVDLFSSAGYFDKAIYVIKMVPPSKTLVLWMVLLNRCQKWTNVELGKHAFENIVQLDEKYAAAYVCMSNLYVNAGLCKEADKIEDLRIKNNAWKIPGRCWWTDLSKNVHVFTVDDKKHPMRKVIYAKLKDIRLKLFLDGCSPCLDCVSQAA